MSACDDLHHEQTGVLGRPWLLLGVWVPHNLPGAALPGPLGSRQCLPNYGA
jgi:hypothetical protein